MKKLPLGLLSGFIIGLLDVIPMILQKISWNANLSAFFHWIIVGFFISTTNIKFKGVLKGIIISILALIPLIFLVWWNDYSSIIPMSISTIIFGSILGFVIEKYGE